LSGVFDLRIAPLGTGKEKEKMRDSFTLYTNEKITENFIKDHLRW
jgi:hypothetical protein